MSTAIAKNFQVGSDSTATNNFTIRQPTTPDGTVRIANGNSGTTTDLVTVTSAGNVGVGTSLPNYRLQVRTDGASITNWVTSQNATASGPYGAGFIGLADAGTKYFMLYENGDGAAVLTNAFAGPLLLGTNNTERARITSGGEVYIAGTTDQGAYNLQVNGTGVWGAGAYVNGSDERIKDNIAPLQSGLDTVAKLNPVTFQYKESWSKDTSTQPGFIAQELQTALADTNYVDGVVRQGGKYMSVSYQTLIPILTKAIQELKAELDSVKTELALLKGTA